MWSCVWPTRRMAGARMRMTPLQARSALSITPRSLAMLSHFGKQVHFERLEWVEVDEERQDPQEHEEERHPEGGGAAHGPAVGLRIAMSPLH